MSDGTKISWTDATWNPITGCSVVSPGCTNCYAMRLAGTRLKHHWSRMGLTNDTKAGPVWNDKVLFNEPWLDQPLRWKRPRRVFVCAHGDLFHENVPDEWIDRVFAVMALAPQHQFQVLTKRPARMRAYLRRDSVDYAGRRMRAPGMGARDRIRGAMIDLGKYTEIDWPLPNVWLGTSVENQQCADERIPDLIETPAAVRFISAEPLLGPLEIRCFLQTFSRTKMGLTNDPLASVLMQESIESGHGYARNAIDWLIVGAESGPNHRPFDEDWARDLRDQCDQADVAFFYKQKISQGKKIETPELDGRQWTEFPE